MQNLKPGYRDSLERSNPMLNASNEKHDANKGLGQKSMANLVQIINERIYTVKSNSLETSGGFEAKMTKNLKTPNIQKRNGSLSENRNPITRISLGGPSNILYSNKGTDSQIQGQSIDSNLLSKKRTNEDLMKFYRDSVRASLIMDGEGQELLNIENLKLQLLNEKKRDLIRTFTNEQRRSDSAGNARVSQRQIIGMMKGFNQMVVKAKRGLKSQKSLKGKELGGFTKKMFKKITKRNSSFGKKKESIQKELQKYSFSNISSLFNISRLI